MTRRARGQGAVPDSFGQPITYTINVDGTITPGGTVADVLFTQFANLDVNVAGPGGSSLQQMATPASVFRVGGFTISGGGAGLVHCTRFAVPAPMTLRAIGLIQVSNGGGDIVEMAIYNELCTNRLATTGNVNLPAAGTTQLRAAAIGPLVLSAGVIYSAVVRRQTIFDIQGYTGGGGEIDWYEKLRAGTDAPTAGDKVRYRPIWSANHTPADYGALPVNLAADADGGFLNPAGNYNGSYCFLYN